MSFLSWDQQQRKRTSDYEYADTWIYAGLIMHGHKLEELSALKVSAFAAWVAGAYQAFPASGAAIPNQI